MDNNNKIKELEKQIKELKKYQRGLYEYINEVEGKITNISLKSKFNDSRIRILLKDYLNKNEDK